MTIWSLMDPRQEVTKCVSIFNKQGPKRSIRRIPKRGPNKGKKQKNQDHIPSQVSPPWVA